MKKVFFIFISLVLIVFTTFSLRAYNQVKNADVSALKKCHKTKMYEVYLCPGGKNYTRLGSISKHFLNLIVIAEDASFYSHEGFDWYEIKQSFRQNLRAFSYLRGGSTITQQLAKNVFLSPEKSIERKFIEAFLAQKIERTYSKKVILERYVNVIEFGKNIYGIKQAARHYFAKHPSQLSILESAFLTYLVPSPKKYSAVFKKRELTRYSKKRIATLIRKLKLYKRISQGEYNYYVDRIDEFPWSNTANYSVDPEAGLQIIDGDEEEKTDHKVPDEVIQQVIDEEIQKELNEENQVIENQEPGESSEQQQEPSEENEFLDEPESIETK